MLSLRNAIFCPCREIEKKREGKRALRNKVAGAALSSQRWIPAKSLEIEFLISISVLETL